MLIFTMKLLFFKENKKHHKVQKERLAFKNRLDHQTKNIQLLNLHPLSKKKVEHKKYQLQILLLQKEINHLFNKLL